MVRFVSIFYVYLLYILIINCLIILIFLTKRFNFINRINKFQILSMKYFIKFFVISCLLLSSGSIFCQDVPDLDFKSIFPRGEKGIEYVKIYDVDSVSKNELILRIKEWAINSFNSQKSALQSENLESGYLLYQATSTKTYNLPKGWGFSLIGSKIYTITYETKFSINFYVKENKFKVVINNITDRAISAYGVWYEVFNSTMGDRALDVPAVPIEEAGVVPINEYKTHIGDNKYIVRLNYSTNIWRNIDNSIKNLLENLKTSIAIKKKSAFDF